MAWASSCGRRATSSGMATFSSAVNSGSRWWNWNTKPSVRLRNRQRSALGEREHVLPADPQGALVGPIQRPEHVQQRGLAHPRGPDDRHPLPRRDLEVRALQHAQLRGRRAVGLHQAAGDEERFAHHS